MTKTSTTASSWWSPPWEAGDDPDQGWPRHGRAAGQRWHHSSAGLELATDSVIAPLERRYEQVRSRERVKVLAEVFTNDREVEAMLDLFVGAFDHLDVKFLEPAAGSGNFLEAILARKLTLARAGECSTQEQYEHRLLRAVASIYGIDIAEDNVTEARARLAHQLLTHYASDAAGISPTLGFQNASGAIITANVVVGDSIHRVDSIELCDWIPSPGGCFQREWSFALVPQDERGLFWQTRLEDPDPVHYSQLTAAASRNDQTRKVRAS